VPNCRGDRRETLRHGRHVLEPLASRVDGDRHSDTKGTKRLHDRPGDRACDDSHRYLLLAASAENRFCGDLCDTLDGFWDGARIDHTEAAVAADGSCSGHTIGDRRRDHQFPALAKERDERNAAGTESTSVARGFRRLPEASGNGPQRSTPDQRWGFSLVLDREACQSDDKPGAGCGCAYWGQPTKRIRRRNSFLPAAAFPLHEDGDGRQGQGNNARHQLCAGDECMIGSDAVGVRAGGTLLGAKLTVKFAGSLS
jgi:hypothetical protein